MYITTMHLLRHTLIMLHLMKSITSRWKILLSLLHLFKNLILKTLQFFVFLIFNKTNSLLKKYSTLCKLYVSFKMCTRKKKYHFGAVDLPFHKTLEPDAEIKKQRITNFLKLFRGVKLENHGTLETTGFFKRVVLKFHKSRKWVLKFLVLLCFLRKLTEVFPLLTPEYLTQYLMYPTLLFGDYHVRNLCRGLMEL